MVQVYLAVGYGRRGEMSKITLAAVGDISFAGRVEKTVNEHNKAYLFEEVKSDLSKSDILFGNLESVMIPDDFPLEKSSGSPLQSRDSVAEVLRPIGFDVLHTASNHALDCGWRGLVNTYVRILEIGIQPLGTGHSRREARSLRIVEKGKDF